MSLDDRKNNFLLSISFMKNNWGCVVVNANSKETR